VNVEEVLKKKIQETNIKISQLMYTALSGKKPDDYSSEEDPIDVD
jgi:hypothetical protein